MNKKPKLSLGQWAFVLFLFSLVVWAVDYVSNYLIRLLGV